MIRQQKQAIGSFEQTISATRLSEPQYYANETFLSTPISKGKFISKKTLTISNTKTDEAVDSFTFSS